MPGRGAIVQSSRRVCALSTTARPTSRSCSPQTNSVGAATSSIAPCSSRPPMSVATSDSVATASPSKRHGRRRPSAMLSMRMRLRSGRTRSGRWKLNGAASAHSPSGVRRDHCRRSIARPRPGTVKGAKRLSAIRSRESISARATGRAGDTSTTAPKRSGERAAASVAIIPPIELPCTTAVSHPSASMSAGRKRALARTRLAEATGGSVRPKPGRSGATTSPNAARSRITSSQFAEVPPRPWTRRCGGLAPGRPARSTWTAVPRTSTTSARMPVQSGCTAPRSRSTDPPVARSGLPRARPSSDGRTRRV